MHQLSNHLAELIITALLCITLWHGVTKFVLLAQYCRSC